MLEHVHEIELAELHAPRFELMHSDASVYDLANCTGKVQLIQRLWRGDLRDCFEGMQQANAEMHSFLQHVTSNTYRARSNYVDASETHLQFEGVFAQLTRLKSRLQMPIITAALSVCALKHQLPKVLWDMLSAFSKGMLASDKWTEQLCQEAMNFRPPAQYQPLRGVGAAVFDNYSRRCLYKSLISEGAGGYRLDMTNWGTFPLPKQFASPTFDPFEICAFRSTLQHAPATLPLEPPVDPR